MKFIRNITEDDKDLYNKYILAILYYLESLKNRNLKDKSKFLEESKRNKYLIRLCKLLKNILSTVLKKTLNLLLCVYVKACFSL